MVDRFEAHWEFPQAADTIDETHIPIQGFYSIVMQGVVTYRGIFWIYTWVG